MAMVKEPLEHSRHFPGTSVVFHSYSLMSIHKTTCGTMTFENQNQIIRMLEFHLLHCRISISNYSSGARWTIHCNILPRIAEVMGPMI